MSTFGLCQKRLLIQNKLYCLTSSLVEFCLALAALPLQFLASQPLKAASDTLAKASFWSLQNVVSRGDKLLLWPRKSRYLMTGMP